MEMGGGEGGGRPLDVKKREERHKGRQNGGGGPWGGVDDGRKKHSPACKVGRDSV